MSSPTFSDFEVAPLPPGPQEAVYLQPGTAGKRGGYPPAVAFQVAGDWLAWTRQQHTLAVVTRQEGRRVESKGKTQSTFVGALRSEPVNSLMQIFFHSVYNEIINQICGVCGIKCLGFLLFFFFFS